MKTQLIRTPAGAIAKVPTFMPDRKRSFRRLRPEIGRKPVWLGNRSGFGIFAAADSIAAQIHHRRVCALAA
jgi:hypothetical protein